MNPFEKKVFSANYFSRYDREGGFVNASGPVVLPGRGRPVEASSNSPLAANTFLGINSLSIKKGLTVISNIKNAITESPNGNRSGAGAGIGDRSGAKTDMRFTPTGVGDRPGAKPDMTGQIPITSPGQPNPGVTPIQQNQQYIPYPGDMGGYPVDNPVNNASDTGITQQQWLIIGGLAFAGIATYLIIKRKTS